MIEATHLKAHRTAASLLKKGLFPAVSAHQRQTELQASRRLRWRGQDSRDAALRRPDDDHKAQAHASALPPATRLFGDRGYDPAWFRAVLAEKAIEACIPSSRSRKV